MQVYLDNAATTKTYKEVIDCMTPYFNSIFGNPSSQHLFGRDAIAVVDESRTKIAQILNVKPEEIYFTSGGTESDNMAILGVARALKHKGNHIITSAIEHPAVLESCKQLEKEGFKVTYLQPNEDGIVKVSSVIQSIEEKTILVSIMHVNNEIGTIQPIEEIGKYCREKGLVFHTDAVQSASTLRINTQYVDLLSISGHKIHGPKGIGLLYKRNSVPMNQIMYGGHQEREVRPSTLNVPGIVGLAKALEITVTHLDEKNKHIKEIRDLFNKRVFTEIIGTKLNGSSENRVVSNSNICFENVDNDALLMLLDMNGIATSAGAACNAGSLEPSIVLKAIYNSSKCSKNSIRFTFDEFNTQEEVNYVVDTLKDCVNQLRK